MMGNELRFNQKWEFRRKDNSFDSSGDDSKSNSSHEPVLKKHKLLSLVDNETSETSRLQQVENPKNLNKEDQIKLGSTKKTRAGRRKDTRQKGDGKKTGKSGACESASLDSVKVFMDSLLEDLTASREKLFKWMGVEMHKLDTDDVAALAKEAPPAKEAATAKETAPAKEMRSGNNRRKRGQTRRPKKATKSAHIEQNENNQQSQVHVKNQNNIQERNNHKEIVEEQRQSQNNLEEVENVRGQDQCSTGLDARTLNCNGGSLERFLQSSEAAYSRNYFQLREEEVDRSQVSELLALPEKEKGKSLQSCINKSSQQPNLSTKQQVHARNQKSLVLGIRAQSCNLGASERSSKGKKTIEPNTHSRSPENQTHHGVTAGSMPSAAEKNKDENLETPIEPKFALNPLIPAAPSTYSTFPSLLTEPTKTNHGFASFTSNNVQPRRRQPVDSTDYRGYLLATQPEKLLGGFTQLCSRNMNYLYPNNSSYLSSSIGAGFHAPSLAGFPSPFHQGMDAGSSLTSQISLDNLQRENSNMMGLRMGGGAIRFSSGSNALTEQYSGTDLNHISEYRPNNRNIAYQVQNTSSGSLFPN